MKALRLAALLGLAGWFAGGLIGYFFEGGLALGLIAGLLAAILGAILGAGSDLIAALNCHRPLRLPPHLPSDPEL